MFTSWRQRLRRRVAARCGDPETTFAPYGHTFGGWIDAVPGTEHHGFAQVEAGLAGYLENAARVGRRRGTRTGILVGLAGAVVAVLLVWAVTR